MTLRIQKTSGATLRLNRGSGMTWKITPRWSPTDSDAAAYIAAVEQADGQALENGVKVAYDNFVRGCKADGTWNAIKASCILAGARTLAGALVPLVGAAPTNINFVASDYNRKTGLIGDRSTKYILCNRLANAEPASNAHLAVYISQVASTIAGNQAYYIGSDLNNFISRLQSNGNLRVAIRGGTVTYTEGASTGFVAVTRNTSTRYETRVSAQTRLFTTGVATPVANPIGVFNNPSTADASNYSNARIAFYSIGEAVSLDLFDAHATQLINNIAAAIP